MKPIFLVIFLIFTTTYSFAQNSPLNNEPAVEFKHLSNSGCQKYLPGFGLDCYKFDSYQFDSFEIVYKQGATVNLSSAPEVIRRDFLLITLKIAEDTFHILNSETLESSLANESFRFSSAEGLIKVGSSYEFKSEDVPYTGKVLGVDYIYNGYTVLPSGTEITGEAVVVTIEYNLDENTATYDCEIMDVNTNRCSFVFDINSFQVTPKD